MGTVFNLQKKTIGCFWIIIGLKMIQNQLLDVNNCRTDWVLPFREATYTLVSYIVFPLLTPLKTEFLDSRGATTISIEYKTYFARNLVPCCGLI